MHASIRWVLLAFFFFAVATTVLVSSTEFVFQHPQQPEGIRFVSRHGRVVAETLVSNTSPSDDNEPALTSNMFPRVAVDQTRYNFGEMNPSSTASHTFVIRNEGEAPLRLVQGATTCHCTLSKLAQRAIPPGGQGEVTLEWTTHDHATYFGHGATIHTNDPSKPELNLRVEGKVRVLLAVNPATGFNLTELIPGSESHFDVLLFSEVWDDFQVTDVQLLNLDSFKWDLKPIDGAEINAQTKSARRLTLTVPALAASGKPREGVIRLTAQSPIVDDSPDNEPWTIEIPVRVSAAKRFTIYGEAIDDAGMVNLGIIDRGQGARRTFTLKVRDDQRQLSLQKVDATPSFLQVRFEPHPTAPPDLGLHQLTIEVPTDAPACSYIEATPARLKLIFDHPRIQEVELSARFSITD